MSRQHITRCDVEGCDLIKAEGNHWWTIDCPGDAIIFGPHGKISSASKSYDACGDDHLLKILGREAAALMEKSK